MHYCDVRLDVKRPAQIFYNVPSPTEIYTLSLHDALPILRDGADRRSLVDSPRDQSRRESTREDRKSTRLNSSHSSSSYAVFCLEKKNHEAAGRDLHRGAVQTGAVMGSCS